MTTTKRTVVGRTRRSATPARRGALAGRVAIVAGATRGAGRGVAWALGEAGATVYCTGRSVAGRPSPYGRKETIEQTAALVTDAGGKGIAVRVDHTVDAEIAGLMARVKKDEGRLDVLVNTLAGEDPSLAWRTKFIGLETDAVANALRRAFVSHLITARHAVPLLRPRTGLIVEVTDGDTLLLGGMSVVGTLIKTLQKVLAFVLAQELRKKQIAVVTLSPGFLRSETTLEHFKVTEANWRDGGKKDKHFLESETPRFVGRAIAALAADPRVLTRSGALTSSWALARDYGFTPVPRGMQGWGRIAIAREPASEHAALGTVPSTPHPAPNSALSTSALSTRPIAAASRRGRAATGRRDRVPRPPTRRSAGAAVRQAARH